MNIDDFYTLLNQVVKLEPMQRIAISAIPMLLAIPVHEAAHGYAG